MSLSSSISSICCIFEELGELTNNELTLSLSYFTSRFYYLSFDCWLWSVTRSAFFRKWGTGTCTEWESDLFYFLSVLNICFSEDFVSFSIVLVVVSFLQECWSIFFILSSILDLTFFNCSFIVMIPFIDYWILAVLAGSFCLFIGLRIC
jgi:hypothetical protein